MTRYAGTLTAEHLATIVRVRDEWMTAGLSTEPIDHAACERAVADVYDSIDKPTPPVIFMSSPVGGLFAYETLHSLDQLGDQLRGQLGVQLRGQLGVQLWGQLRGQLRGQLGGQLWGQLGDQLGGQLGDQLGDELYRSFSLWGDAYWMAIYFLALPFAELPSSPRLDAICDLSRQAGWWWPYEGLAIVTDRPSIISRDGQARLHCETGPALAYRDGYSLHSWHGVTVPDWVTGADGGPTPERIFAESNAEVRRCAIESFGWDRFIDAAQLSLVDRQPDPGNPGNHIALYDVPAVIYDEDVRVILCTNGSPERDGTRRRFGLTVPADMPDAVTAAAWTYQLSKDEYVNCARRT